ncbi:MAG TPA: hypothetical protein VFB22_03055 [Candidatus Baltobacteraceae bacterium]|nr:hypothetical protein [Candidatus Baltobacteraceae bacterium]
MAHMAKVSVTVDKDVLGEVKALAGEIGGGKVSLSAIMDEALHTTRSRLRVIKLLRDMEWADPSTDADRAAAERMWRVARG